MLLTVTALVATGACDDGGEAVTSTTVDAVSTAAPTTTSTSVVATASTSDVATTTTAPPAPTTAVAEPPTTLARPDWLGQRPLPLRPDGYGEVQPTPPELVDRRLPTIDLLPPPPTATFAATINEVPADVLARSTWHDGCPVAAGDLRYLTMTFWGFDDRAHTGEMLVNSDSADAVVGVFRTLFDARFPIEEMRVVRADELEAPPTGDGNNTSAFVCRNAVLSENWSQHAYGRAIDISPFHNPYVREDLVLPELASAYVDRANVRPGMIIAGDVVVEAFASIGWGWGGDFRTLRDDMHFSLTGH